MTATNEPYEMDSLGWIWQGARNRVVAVVQDGATDVERQLILAALNGGRLGCGCDGKTQWCVLCEPGAVNEPF